MSDNDEARGMSDELKIEITAEDLRTAREMLRRSEIAHCFRCLNPAPPGPDPPGWGDCAPKELAEIRQQRLTYARLIVAMRLPSGLESGGQARRPQRRSIRGVYAVGS